MVDAAAALRRLGQRTDPWKGFFDRVVALDDLRDRVSELEGDQSDWRHAVRR